MRRPRIPRIAGDPARLRGRIAALLVLAGLGGNTGCTHYHYYGAPPAIIGTPQQVICEPQVQVQRQAAAVPYGSVCEVPPASSGGVFVAATPRRTEVLVSKPQGSASRARGGSRFAWHRPDPEGLATTRVEGGLDDSALR
jgi:hypothetical protein